MRVLRPAQSIAAAAGLLLALSGAIIPAPRGADASGAVVACVNGAPIREPAVERALGRLPDARVSAADPALRAALIDRLVDEELLVQRAAEMGLVTSDRGVRKALARAAIDAAVRDASARAPARKRAAGLLRGQRHHFALPRRVRVRAISFDASRDPDSAMRRAQEAAAAIAGGAVLRVGGGALRRPSGPAAARCAAPGGGAAPPARPDAQRGGARARPGRRLGAAARRRERAPASARRGRARARAELRSRARARRRRARARTRRRSAHGAARAAARAGAHRPRAGAAADRDAEPRRGELARDAPLRTRAWRAGSSRSASCWASARASRARATDAPATSALPPGVAALVDGRPIRAEEAARAVEMLAGDRREPLSRAERERVLERLIDEELLVDSALARGFLASERSVRDAVTLAMVESVVAESASRAATPEELRAELRGRARRGGTRRIRRSRARRCARASKRSSPPAPATPRCANICGSCADGRASAAPSGPRHELRRAPPARLPCSGSPWLLAFAPGGANAHTRSQSFSTWDVRGQDVVAVFSAPLYEATRLVPLAPDASDLDALLRDHLASRIRVSRGGADCPALAAPRSLAARTGLARVELRFACSGRRRAAHLERRVLRGGAVARPLRARRHRRRARARAAVQRRAARAQRRAAMRAKRKATPPPSPPT